jgi:hypothetical protein
MDSFFALGAPPRVNTPLAVSIEIPPLQRSFSAQIRTDFPNPSLRSTNRLPTLKSIWVWQVELVANRFETSISSQRAQQGFGVNLQQGAAVLLKREV